MNNLSNLNTQEQSTLFAVLRNNITYNSNAIEGLSLTYGETENLLTHGTTAKNKPIHEHLIMLGFAKAFDLVLAKANNPNEPLTIDFIKDLHAIIFRDANSVAPNMIEKPLGSYRSIEKKIKASSVKLSNPMQISNDIEMLMSKYISNDMSLADIAKFHKKFELVHPFGDGNGRVGRLIIMFQAIQNDIIPPLILNTQRNEYLNALENSNDTVLTDFLDVCVRQAHKMIQKSTQINTPDLSM